MNCQGRNVAGDMAAAHPAIAQAIAEFDAVLGQIMGPRTNERKDLRVPMSVWSDEAGAHVELDVPGVLMDAIDITMERDVLTIKGRRTRELPGGAEAAVDELRGGEFERHVRVGDTFDQDKVSATLKDGVLHVRLARKPQTPARKVTISTT